MDDRLASLLVDLSALSDKEAEQAVFDEYIERYTDAATSDRRIGVRKAHDGESVVFFEDRFGHAFSETVSWYSKGRFCRQRGQRVGWIGPAIAGEIEGTECWLLPPRAGNRDRPVQICDRVYIVPDENYVVWLNPRRDGRWRFASAYVAGYGDIRRYKREGRFFWAQKNTP